MSKLQIRDGRTKYFCQLTAPEVVARIQRFESGDKDNRFTRIAPHPAYRSGQTKTKLKPKAILKRVPEHLF